jgi:hypothetical protein
MNKNANSDVRGGGIERPLWKNRFFLNDARFINNIFPNSTRILPNLYIIAKFFVVFIE